MDKINTDVVQECDATVTIYQLGLNHTYPLRNFFAVLANFAVKINLTAKNTEITQSRRKGIIQIYYWIYSTCPKLYIVTDARNDDMRN